MRGAGDTRSASGGGAMRSYGGTSGGGGFSMGAGGASGLAGALGGAPALFRAPQPQHQPQFCGPTDGSFPTLAMKAETLSAPLRAYPDADAAASTATRRASLVGAQRGSAEQLESTKRGSASDNQAEHDIQPHAQVALPKRETATRVTATGEIHVIRRRNVGVPKFLRFLFQILESEDPGVISWAHDGSAFQIRQPDELAAQILPKYFKHNKVSSFQRQLNYFGFKKWTKTQTSVCTFSHPFFLRHDKNRMKLIKRKERASPALCAVTSLHTSASSTCSTAVKSSPAPMTLAPAQCFSQSHSASNSPVRQSVPPPQTTNPALQAPMTPNQVAQKALKRQKPSSVATGAAAAFLNSAMAGRRHSTGMLPGAEAFSMGMAAAAAAAKSSANGRKRTGAPDEQELELELEARADALARASPQQQLQQLRRLAAAKEVSARPPSKAARGKRNSLPHMLQPHFGDSLGSGLSLGSATTDSFGRRKSEQLLADFHANSAKSAAMAQFAHLLTPMSASGSRQPSPSPQSSSIKDEASAVLPITSDSLLQGAYQQQQQQQRSDRQDALFGSLYAPQVDTRAELAMRDVSGSLQTQSNGWGTSSGPAYRPQSSGNMMAPNMLPFKFGDPNAGPAPMATGFQGVGVVDFSQQRAQRPAPPLPLPSHQQQSQHQQQQQQQQRQQQQQQQQYEPPKDYIDVLLESDALSENLPTDGSGAWGDPSGYSQPQPAHYAIMHQQQLQTQQAQQTQQTQQSPNSSQQFQLSPMGGMPQQHPNQRF